MASVFPAHGGGMNRLARAGAPGVGVPRHAGLNGSAYSRGCVACVPPHAGMNRGVGLLPGSAACSPPTRG